MDKRFQFFVSSTYEDLQEEWQEVMQALLDLDCIPCGESPAYLDAPGKAKAT